MNERTRSVLVVLLSAFMIAIESVAIEGAINTAHLSLFLVSSVPLIVGGVILLSTNPRSISILVRGFRKKEWILMIALSISYAIAVFLWFDAIGRIGASRAALLGGGSFTVLFVVLLSIVFLAERLNYWECLGSLLVLIGVFLVLANKGNVELAIGVGEIETILSAFVIAVSIVLTTSLLRHHNPIPLTSLQLVFAGTSLVLPGYAFGLFTWPNANGFLILLGTSLLLSVGILAYNFGLQKVGASLTSVLFALTGMMTIGVQYLVLFAFPKVDVILPKNVALAALGGCIAFAGVYLLCKNPLSSSPLHPL